MFLMGVCLLLSLVLLLLGLLFLLLSLMLRSVFIGVHRLLVGLLLGPALRLVLLIFWLRLLSLVLLAGGV